MGTKTTNRFNVDHRDLRSVRAAHERQVQLFLDRSPGLDRDKRALLRLILDQGATYSQVARLSGEHAGTVSRRVRAMLARLRGRHLAPVGDDVLAAIGPLEQTILIESFMHGTGQAKIAKKLGISRYRVRKTLQSVISNQ